MKNILPTLVMLLILSPAHAQELGQPGNTPQTSGDAEAGASAAGSTSNPYAAGVFSEEGEHDLAAAAAAYRQAIHNFDRQREGVANAIFRLGEVYRKLGRLEERRSAERGNL